MDVIVDDALAAQRNRPLEPVCVILTAAVRERVVEAADWIHADGSVVEQVQQTQHRRPFAHVEGTQISVVAFAVDPTQRAGGGAAAPRRGRPTGVVPGVDA